MKKSILITGATGYFGKYITESLSEKYHIIATSRSLAKLNKTFSSSAIIKIEMDLYNLDECEKKLKQLCSEYSIHGLINNAYDFSSKTGFNTTQGSLEEMNLSMMRSSLESGLLAPMLFSQIVGKSMIEKKIKGSIINISSMYGLVSPDKNLYQGKTIFNPMTYGVCKSGINGLTRYLASFWGEHGIRCNSVAPGPFPNMETESVNAPKDLEFIKRLENKTVLGRTGHPTDLLGIISLLLSDESGFITGQVISVDGGWTII